MKQRYLFLVLFALLIASFTTSFRSYRTTELLVTEDMGQALQLALAEQASDVISQDTIRTFNGYLQMAELRGRATITVDTRQKDRLVPKALCSMATIFSLSDQRPASALWAATLLWMMFCLYRQRRGRNMRGQILLVDGKFVSSDGEEIHLTPMQQQLMEMFCQTPDHTLRKEDICAALWPKKPDASDTLYTLIRRLRPIIEANSSMKIESDRGKTYC